MLTNLSEFADHGAPVTPAAEAALPEPLAADGAPEEDDGAELVTVPALTLIPERRIAVQRSYSAFVSLRAALAALPVPGAASLPELPGKQLFTSADAKTLEKRRVAFLALLQHIGRHEGLACCAATSAFLSGETPCVCTHTAAGSACASQRVDAQTSASRTMTTCMPARCSACATVRRGRR